MSDTGPPSRRPEDPAAVERARRLLLDAGVPPERVEAAAVDGSLHLLAVDALVLPGLPRYTRLEIAELAGVDADQLRRLWGALGFPHVGDDEVMFTDADLEALTTLSGLIALSRTDDDLAVELARVIGASMSRIAEAEISAVPGFQADLTPAQRAELFVSTAFMTLPGLARLLDYTWRRHLQAAARRATLWRTQTDVHGGHVAELLVGFADLVGFTALSQQLSAGALARVVARFEQVAYDTVHTGGGQVVKMIGDEVMFVASDVVRGATIGLDLSHAYAGDELLSDVRVGLAHGDVLGREGDWYGPVVNRASRIVGIARAGSVVTDEAVRDRLASHAEFHWRPLRPRFLKDMGRQRLWALQRAAEAGGPARPGVVTLLTEPRRARVERSQSRHPSTT